MGERIKVTNCSDSDNDDCSMTPVPGGDIPLLRCNPGPNRALHRFLALLEFA